MRAQIAKLQAAVDQTGPKNRSSASSGMPKGAGKSMGIMDDDGEKGEMAAGGSNTMAAPTKAKSMCCMGEMGMPPAASAGTNATTPPPGMAGMSGSSSAMPGQPGASHLLHIGSTGFFLNHSRHITLTADQRLTLTRLKENAMLAQVSEQRRIDQAEQDLYTLTGAEQPNNSKIQTKIGEIEKLRAGQRINFIQAVGEASNVLTHDQHRALLGTMPANNK